MLEKYLYIPQSVEAVTALEQMLTLSEPLRTVRFEGIRLIEDGLKSLASGATDHSAPSQLSGIVIQLASELLIEDLDDLIDGHSRSAQQGFLTPVAELETIEEEGLTKPVGTSGLLLSGNEEDQHTYFALSANMDMARCHCRVIMLPEIIFDAEDAFDRFAVLRRQIGIYLSYGVQRFTGFQELCDEVDQDRLMKVVRLVGIVTDEKFPKFRDSLYEPGFREEFIELFLADLTENSELQSNEEQHSSGDALFILFCLIRDLVGTHKLHHSLEGTIDPALHGCLGRLVLSS